jgi:hypothetical protein
MRHKTIAWGYDSSYELGRRNQVSAVHIGFGGYRVAKTRHAGKLESRFHVAHVTASAHAPWPQELVRV